MTDDAVRAALYSLIRAHGQEVGENDEIIANTKLADLGVDSLEMLSLAADIELEFSFDIDDSTLTSAKTVGDLLEIIASAGKITP